MSAKLNLKRHDLSDWLIHFTRKVSLLDSDAPDAFPDEWRFAEGVEDTDLSPFFLLRRTVRMRQILSTWAVRSTGRGVYGPHPAVCLTEMPLSAFLDASRARAMRGEHMSPYGILLRKEQAFRAGARPVIYGLSTFSERAATLQDGTRRYPAKALPDVEQYRFVAFNPNGGIDWTHEREWRWPNRDYEDFHPINPPKGNSPDHAAWAACIEAREADRYGHDGLCIDAGSFENVGLLVKSQRQAQLLIHDIVRLIDAGLIRQSLFGFILQHDALPPREALLEHADVEQAISAATLDLSPYYSIDPQLAKAIRSRFDAIVRELTRGNDEEGEWGQCWLWLTDNTHPLVRALVLAPDEEKRVQISQPGRYLIRLPELGDGRSLRQREEMTKAIARRCDTDFGTHGTYYSVIPWDDPDGVPFYTGHVDSDDIYMNYAHRTEDF